MHFLVFLSIKVFSLLSFFLFSAISSFTRMSIFYKVTLYMPLFADMSDVNTNEARRSAGDYERSGLTVSTMICKMFHRCLPSRAWHKSNEIVMYDLSCHSSLFTWPSMDKCVLYILHLSTREDDVFHSTLHYFSRDLFLMLRSFRLALNVEISRP